MTTATKNKKNKKPNKPKAPVDLPKLLKELRDHWQLAIDSLQKSLDHSHEVGLRLTAIRDSMRRGFKKWCESKDSGLPFGYRQAKNLIRIAKKENWKLIESERKRTPDLSPRAALQLLTRANKRAKGIDPDAKPQEGGGIKQWYGKVTQAQLTDALSVTNLTRSQADELLKALKIKVA